MRRGVVWKPRLELSSKSRTFSTKTATPDTERREREREGELAILNAAINESRVSRLALCCV